MNERSNYSSDSVPIWGGRFQPPHIAHEYISKTVFSRFAKACVALVNPDPTSPPVHPDEFERFHPTLNPLTYFERLILWSRILHDQGLLKRTVIVPTWHPRISLLFDNAFLPPQSRRFWVVPAQSDEEWMKVRDFEKLGERVFTDIQIPRKLMGVSSSEIRDKFTKGRVFSRLLPVAIRDYEEAILKGGVNRQGDFRILPILEEVPNIEDIISCIPVLSTSYFTIALPVNVKTTNNWWFEPESPRHLLTYYERYELIVEIFVKLKLNLPLITPLLIINNEPLLIDAFLPHRDVRTWLIQRSQNLEKLIARLSLSGERIERLSSNSICHKNMNDAQISLEKSLNLLHLSERSISSKRSQDMGGIQFGHITIVKGNVVNVEGDQKNYYNADTERLNDKIYELLQSVADGRSDDVDRQAEAIEKLTLKTQDKEIKSVVTDSVKMFIDNNPDTKSEIGEWTQSFMISAAGSGLITMIQEAVHLLIK